MGFICGLLLMYMDEEDAFLMLVGWLLFYTRIHNANTEIASGTHGKN